MEELNKLLQRRKKKLVKEKQKASELEKKLVAAEEKFEILEIIFVAEEERLAALEHELGEVKDRISAVEKELEAERERALALEEELATEKAKSSAALQRVSILETQLAGKADVLKPRGQILEQRGEVRGDGPGLEAAAGSEAQKLLRAERRQKNKRAAAPDVDLSNDVDTPTASKQREVGGTCRLTAFVMRRGGVVIVVVIQIVAVHSAD